MRHVSLVCLLVAAAPALAQREFGFDNTKPSGQPYLKPEESVARMKVADGFEVKLFAAEPMVVNPIAMTVDEKGRVWVVECFEYPSRTPKGKLPRDRIKILEDTQGTGKADKVTTWWTPRTGRFTSTWPPASRSVTAASTSGRRRT